VVRLDFRGVPNREPLEPGYYMASIQEAILKESSTGKPMLSITYSIFGHSDGTPVDSVRKLWDNFILTDSALWRAKQFFDAIEIDTNAIVEIDPTDIVGLRLGVKVIQEIFNGIEIRNTVKGFKTMAQMANAADAESDLPF